ncbi:MAG: hypothetical protein K8R77_06755 [Anaerolineaceae bacterium]|nr:hypothetical protein [Anaerolineaceae bacterium]
MGAIFDRQSEKDIPWLTWGWLGGLYAMGVFLWGKFFNWGSIPFDWLDWAEVNAPRLAFVKDAVMEGVLPLHMADTSALRNVTDRFLTVPDPILSPQVLLLKFLDVGPFVLLHVLLLFTLGAWGLLWFRRRYNLSLVSFTALFLLFNFNGHILAHLSVGHVTFAGYFLFPWFLVLIFQLVVDGQKSWAWVAKMAILLFVIWLQGAFHQYVWALMFLGLIGLTSWKAFWPALKAGIAAVLLSMVRILPPAMMLGQYDDEFLGGYPSVWDFVRSMVTIVFPADSIEAPRNMLNTLAWWEFDLYLGLIGAAFLLYFGLGRWLKYKRSETAYPALLLPVAVLFVFSIGRVYRLVRLIPIPLLAGERASIRMIILPVVTLLILAAIEFQAWLRERKLDPVLQVSSLGILFLLGHDLWQHLKVWQVTNAVEAFPVARVDLTLKVVGNHPDPAYTNMLVIGAVVSALTLAALIVLWVRERRAARA